jgi:UDP-2,3-diacylglucosamine hydrolase
VADYFLSDVHLRLDHPDRGRRLSRVVARLAPSDTLTIVGDLCDFWFAARQRQADPMSCEGLRSLAEFRSRGGSITVLAGNHDAWLGPFYEQTLGATFLPDRLETVIQGIKVRVAHGHRLGAHTPWKTVL